MGSGFLGYSEYIFDKVKEAAEEVHSVMGSGHTETVYEAAMEVELGVKYGPVRRQVPCQLTYKEWIVGTGFIDILLDEWLIIEIKAIAKLTKKDEAQVRKYLDAMCLDKGLLINYGQSLEIIEVGKGNIEPTPSSTSRDSNGPLL